MTCASPRPIALSAGNANNVKIEIGNGLKPLVGAAYGLMAVKNVGTSSFQPMAQIILGSAAYAHLSQETTARSDTPDSVCLSKETNRKTLSILNQHRLGAIVLFHALHYLAWHTHARMFKVAIVAHDILDKLIPCRTATA